MFPSLRRTKYVAAIACIAVVTWCTDSAGQSAASGTAKNFLWKVQSGTGVLYLAGSVHALSESVYPLNPAFQRAFDASEAIVEEIDLAEAGMLTAAPLIAAKGMYQDGRTFDQVVSKETSALVADRMKSIPTMLDLLRPMKPWMINLMLTALQLEQAGLDASLGLDKYFFDKAKASGKTTLWLETAESQIDRLDQMPIAVQEQMLRSTLRALDTDRGGLQMLLAAWQRGDVQALEKSLLAEFEGFRGAYTSLIVERNRNWLPQLDACLTRRSPCFVIVGAAHLVGPDGLLVLLQRKGYRLEQQ